MIFLVVYLSYIGGVRHRVLARSSPPRGVMSAALGPDGEILNRTLPSRSIGLEPCGRTPEARFEASYVFFLLQEEDKPYEIPAEICEGLE